MTVRRPDPARHHLPGAARLHVDAGPADLASSTARWIRCACRCCHPRASASPSRRCWSNWAAGSSCPAFTTPRAGASSGLPGLHRQLRDRARLGHRLPGRLARQGRRQEHARRAQPQAVGDVRRRTTASSTPPAAGAAVHAQLERRLHALGAGRGCGATATRSSSTCTASSCSASAWRRRASTRAQPPERLRSGCRPTSTRCPSGTRRWKSRPPTPRLPAQRGDAAADGDVPLVGFAERLAAPDPCPQLPDVNTRTALAAGHRRRRLDVGGVALGQGALHVPPLARRWSPARCGPGTPSARPRAPGTWRRCQRIAEGLPAQPPDPRGAARRRRRHASPTATPSPARPPGTTCGCASYPAQGRRARPRPGRSRADAAGAGHGRRTRSAAAGWPGMGLG
jgi:hypothetical protein